MNPKVQIISADQVPDLLEQVLTIRNPELATKRQKGRKNARARARNWSPQERDVTIKIPAGTGLVEAMELAMHATDKFQAPKKPEPLARGIGIIEGATGKARVTDLNRDLNLKRARKYLSSMVKGEWILTPDAIAITENGLIVNGQHRLAAAYEFAISLARQLAENPDKKLATPMPQFIVAWGIDKRAVALMDEAYRSPTDRRTIAFRYGSLEEKPA